MPGDPVLPDGLGVNIHFTDPRPGEMEMLAEGGFRWVRMDLAWGSTEREPGQYDGPDPKEPEHHFGTVLHPYRADRKPVYEPKPAYLAARTLTTVLSGFRFNKRLATASEEEYVLLFSKGDDVRLAAWTVSEAPRTVLIPASPTRFTVIGHTGEGLAPLVADDRGLSVSLTDAPQYLVPETPNELHSAISTIRKSSNRIQCSASGGPL